LVGNQFSPINIKKQRCYLGITPDILIYFTHNERKRENKKERDKKGEKEKGNRNPLGSARFSVFLAGLLYTIISIQSCPSLYTQTGKYATQESGIQWHEIALRYSTFTLVREEVGWEREKK